MAVAATAAAERAARGIVLAGGRSTRFGADKLAAVERGRPLLAHAIAALDGLCDEVVVAIGPDRPVPDLPSAVRVLRDEREAEGPLAGLVTGLAGLGDDARALLVAGDMPEVHPGVLRLLLAALDDDHPVAVLGEEPDDRPRPFPMAVVAWPAGLLAAGLLATGERRLRALPERAGAAVVPWRSWTVLDPRRATLRDVDVPADLLPDGPSEG